MDAATQRALADHNRRFYAAHADDFSATRDHPWPGWERACLPPGCTPPARVLDVGCGNGRLGAWLARHGPIAYSGLDVCEALLDAARAALPAEARLLQRDLCDPREGATDAALPDERFDLVCAFGLLHHVPGFAQRRRLVRALATRVAPGGRLALAFWRFAERERFERRRLDWQQFAAIDPDRLEPGDCLLAWGDGGASRYCHAADDREIEQLLEGHPLARRDDFVADGREGDLNRYVVLENA